MDDAIDLPAPLLLLACLYRERRSGVLAIGPPDTALRLLLREGQVVGLGPVPGPPAPLPRMPRPDDSARMRLERVLAEVGIRSRSPRPGPAAAPPLRSLRARLLESLADGTQTATFEEGASAPDLAETAGATEPLILEAARRCVTPGPCGQPSGTSTSSS